MLPPGMGGAGGMPGMPPGMAGLAGMPGMANMAAGMAQDMPELEGAEGLSAPGGMPMTVEVQQQQPKQELPDFTTGEWCTLYPTYIDSSKTVAEGRRVGKEFCCEGPIAQEMAEVLVTKCHLAVAIEQGKAHPRDPTRRAGRVRVKFRKADGITALNKDLASKKALLRRCGVEVPNTQVRATRDAAIAERKAQKDAAKAKALGDGESKKSKKKKKGKR